LPPRHGHPRRRRRGRRRTSDRSARWRRCRRATPPTPTDVGGERRPARRSGDLGSQRNQGWQRLQVAEDALRSCPLPTRVEQRVAARRQALRSGHSSRGSR
jgi:hypothetical protein